MRGSLRLESRGDRCEARRAEELGRSAKALADCIQCLRFPERARSFFEVLSDRVAVGPLRRSLSRGGVHRSVHGLAVRRREVQTCDRLSRSFDGTTELERFPGGTRDCRSRWALVLEGDFAHRHRLLSLATVFIGRIWRCRSSTCFMKLWLPRTPVRSRLVSTRAPAGPAWSRGG